MLAIKTENLSFTYAGSRVPALRNISIEIKEGEFVLIIGPTGCGKSTLVRTFNGLIPHFYRGEMEGRVIVYGVDTRESKVSDLSRYIGMVFQDPENQLVTLTVEQEVAFGPENLGLSKGDIKRRVEYSLRTMKIEHLKFRVPFELSSGEQQKVAVASILSMYPRVLILDEPTAHMDPLSAYEFIQSLKTLNDEGKTIVIVEHRIDFIAPFATKVIVMNNGEVVDEGEPREVFSRGIIERIGLMPPRASIIFKALLKNSAWNKIPLSIEELLDTLSELISY